MEMSLVSLKTNYICTLQNSIVSFESYSQKKKSLQKISLTNSVNLKCVTVQNIKWIQFWATLTSLFALYLIILKTKSGVIRSQFDSRTNIKNWMNCMNESGLFFILHLNPSFPSHLFLHFFELFGITYNKNIQTTPFLRMEKTECVFMHYCMEETHSSALKSKSGNLRLSVSKWHVYLECCLKVDDIFYFYSQASSSKQKCLVFDGMFPKSNSMHFFKCTQELLLTILKAGLKKMQV